MGEGRLSADECERLALEVRARAGLGPLDVEPTNRTAARLLGPRGVRVIPRFTTIAALVRVNGETFIVMQRDARDANFVIGHELGHWALREIARYSGPEEERLADRIGAAIVAPPAALRKAASWYGERSYRELALAFMATRSLVALRLAEVFCRETALVAPRSDRRVRIVTQGAFPWAPEAEVQRWARETAPRGVRKVRLHGVYDHGRTVLQAS